MKKNAVKKIPRIILLASVNSINTAKHNIKIYFNIITKLRGKNYIQLNSKYINKNPYRTEIIILALIKEVQIITQSIFYVCSNLFFSCKIWSRKKVC